MTSHVTQLVCLETDILIVLYSIITSFMLVGEIYVKRKMIEFLRKRN